MGIQWYPGHMKKTKNILKENLKLVNVVIELLDARVPLSSQNPDLKDLTGNKMRVIVLNKADLAEDHYTDDWVYNFKEKGYYVVPVSSVKGYGIKQLKAILSKFKASVTRGKRPIRAMVIGVPNVGKSSFINSLARKSSAKIGGVPGITRGKQWIKIPPDTELLDTPGILWPKIESEEMGFHLAITGAIKFEILDYEDLAYRLIEYLSREKPEYLTARYKLKNISPPGEILRQVGIKRGLLRAGGEIDTSKASEIILKEFRDGLLGKITLEHPVRCWELEK